MSWLRIVLRVYHYIKDGDNVLTVLFADKQQDGIDKSTLSGRLLEIRAELDRYHNEQSRLELEMTNDNAEPVSIELLRTRSSPREVRRRVSAVNLHHPTIRPANGRLHLCTAEDLNASCSQQDRRVQRQKNRSRGAQLRC